MTTHTSAAARKFNEDHRNFSILTISWTIKEQTVPTVSVGYVLRMCKEIVKKPINITTMLEHRLEETDLLTHQAASYLMQEIIHESIY
jgi:hypothetical protein